LKAALVKKVLSHSSQEQRIGDMEGEQGVVEMELIREFGEGCDRNVEEADGDP
jgi:hypothetical protein